MILVTNYFLQSVHLHKLRNCKLSNRNNEFGQNAFQLSLEPGRTILDFCTVWNPIASFYILSGKASAHSSHVYKLSKRELL